MNEDTFKEYQVTELELEDLVRNDALTNELNNAVIQFDAKILEYEARRVGIRAELDALQEAASELTAQLKLNDTMQREAKGRDLSMKFQIKLAGSRILDRRKRLALRKRALETKEVTRRLKLLGKQIIMRGVEI